MITTCQICGRPIKLVNGAVAHHGYRQPWRLQGSGARTSSCPGSKYPAYEVSRDRIPPVRADYELQREATQRSADAMISTPPESFTVRHRYDGYERGDPATVLTRPEGFDAETNFRRGAYRPMTYELEHSSRTRTLRQHVAMLAEAIKFLDERYAAWRPPAKEAAA